MQSQNPFDIAVAEFDSKIEADPPTTPGQFRAVGDAYMRIAEPIRTVKVELSAICCACEIEIEALGERAKVEGSVESATRDQILDRGRREVRETNLRAAAQVRSMWPLAYE